MWKLFKQGIKPWEYTMSYDDKGNPVVYKDDIDLIFFVDSLNKQGAEHEKWKQDQNQEPQKSRPALGQYPQSQRRKII